ncbi:tRNA (adenine(58)-N(1))-methyltransferase non-catalytic subunit trm6 isoform X1 [Olea europaea var. sylvestris]|uniref:tRNA (adenine(58)-N(1))-methyltransferase non-catalytic subunit trm6 isoform X1 n=1 Tax=Olea europaea var. sylvestris TaxID=158386 RepID=UPI000C1CD456|nr:tRNA (adenine(58)-N(1))-methyltransferase non-catalytic subunit trm6 isoform X1 [Olea europaea var. sylvestris]
MDSLISDMSISKSGGISCKDQNRRITWEGCSVLLDINDGDRVLFARLTAGSKIKIGNKNCSLQPLIGCPFGSSFQVEDGKEGPVLSRVLQSTKGNSLQITEESRDNRMLVDNNSAQSLTGEDIDEMRRKGASGDEIVKALIANSATFEKKTAFSQEKYLLKKQKKYAPRVLLRRPFARSICEAYYKKHAERIGFLRVDTLSLLLSLANVSAYSDVLLVDMLDGIVTGAVAERLGVGTGYVCNTYRGVTLYPINIVQMFNFNNDISQRIVHSSVAELHSYENGTSPPNDQLEDASTIRSQQNEQILSPSAQNADSMEENEDGNMEIMTDVAASTKVDKGTKAGRKAPVEAIKLWKENGFSSLIIAAPNLDPWGIVKEVLPLLSYSASFAIYHQYLQPLATCMNTLQAEKLAIGLQISEPWLREYQVLPSRTHPHMQMSATGGYILSGTRISGGDQTQTM